MSLQVSIELLQLCAYHALHLHEKNEANQSFSSGSEILPDGLL